MELLRDYYDENMVLLKKYHPQLWQDVKGFSDELPGEFSISEKEEQNLLVYNENNTPILLHNAENPHAELEQYFALVPQDATGVVTFVGMGLGQAPSAMLENRAHIRHLIIFEPVMGIFIQALHAINLEQLFKDRRAVIAVGSEINISAVLAPLGKAMVLESQYVLRHIPSFNYCMTLYQDLYDEVFKQVNTLNVGGSTTRAFGEKFVDNRFRHLTAIHHQQLLENLGNAFSDIPAIIVAAGPSLNKNIHLISKAKGKAVIIAVDTALPALLAHGVVPDFTMAIDMKDIVAEKIIDVSAAGHETSLVCASWVSPTIPKNFPAKQVYWTFAAKHMEKWLNDLLGGTVLTAGAGTVAHLSFTAAIQLGCSPIVFVGQDLAFTNKQDHVQHTSLTTIKRVEECTELHWVEGYGGGKIQTSRAWLSDKNHFERLIASIADRQFINSTEGGVRLEGTEEMPLQDVLSLYCQKSINFTSIVDSSQSHNTLADRDRMIENFAQMLKSVVSLEKNFNKFNKAESKARKNLAKLRKKRVQCFSFKQLPTAMRQLMGEMDKLNEKLDRSPIWALLDEVTMTGLLQSERLNHEINQLKDDPQKYLAWIGKNIERIILVNGCRSQVLASFKQNLKFLRASLMEESRLLQKLSEEKDRTIDNLMDLLRLYYENGDHVLMEKTIMSHDLTPDNSAEISFYLGDIAAHQSRFDQAERYFTQAISLDPSWSEKINECQHSLADQYVGFYHEWQVNDSDVALRMLFKGIHHCRRHQAIKSEIILLIDKDLVEIQTAAEQGTLGNMEKKVMTWSNEITKNLNLQTTIGASKATSLFRYLGNIMIGRQDYLQAIEAFSTALTFSPKSPDLYLLQADAYFALDDFGAGVNHLDHAVALDSTYAKYWENMGDNLFGSGQVEDAIAAYERCLLTLPEQIELLKKIGDCYQQLGQDQAALEAYKQLKARMQPVIDG